MQLIACQGIRDGDEDPYLIFKDALLHFSKHSSAILSMFINTIPGFQRLCPEN